MAIAARVSPKDVFTPAEWAPFATRSRWRGVALVVHCWLVIGLATVIAIRWPITLPLAVMVIGARQLGLAILMHDAAHGALHPDPRSTTGWASGRAAAAFRAIAATTCSITNTPSRPRTRTSCSRRRSRSPAPRCERKIVRDLTGQTWFKQKFGRLSANLKGRAPGEPVWPLLWQEIVRQRRWLIVNGLAIAGFAAAGVWWVWFAVWLLPRATWLQLVTRLRNIAEHALVAKNEPDPLRHARTTAANWLERAFIAPYWVNYHCEHHMFMHVPCWRLAALRRALAAKGLTERMRGAPGYLAVLSEATAA